jgi:HEAT repeat protein/ferric-dicitrate binding protein FerR (iron transport regulator)
MRESDPGALLELYLLGELPEEQARQVEAWLGERPDRRLELEAARRNLDALDRTLAAPADADALAERIIARLPAAGRRGWRRRGWPLVAAAVLMLAVGLAAWMHSRPRPAPPPPAPSYRAPSAAGNFTILGGGELRRGAEVATHDRETATLTLGGYCRVELAPQTRLKIEGAERAEAVVLQEGQVTCEVDRGIGGFEVQSEVGTVSVKGTRFSVTLAGDTPVMTRRLVVAVFAGAVLVSGPWGQQILAAGQGQAFPGPAPAQKAPANAAPADSAKAQAEALAKKIDARYCRAFVSEVLTNDLNLRVGLRHAFAEPIAKCAMFTFEAKGVPVKEVIERLAKDCGLEIEYRGDTAVFWKKADDKALDGLAKKLKEGDVQARCEAAHDLALLADPRVYPLLFQALDDKDPSVVLWTVRGLMGHATPNVTWLWNMGSGKREGTLRYADGLGPVAETLKKYIAAPPAGTSESDLVWLLAEIAKAGATDTASAVDVLIAQLKDADLSLMMLAARALGDLGDPRALAALEPLVEREAPKNPQAGVSGLYLTLKDALDRIQDPKGYEAKHAQTGPLRPVEDIAADLTSGDMTRFKKARNAFLASTPAAFALAHDPRIADALLECLFLPDVAIKTRAIAYMEKTGDPRAVEPLIKLLQEGDAQVRGVTARVLGALRDPRAVEPLLQAFDTEKPPAQGAQPWQNPRADLLRAVGATRDPRVLDVLVKHLGDAEAPMRVAAEGALRDFHEARAQQALLGVLARTGGVIPQQMSVPIWETQPAGPGDKGPKQVMKGTRTETRDTEDTTLLSSLREIQDVPLVEEIVADIRDAKLNLTAKKGVVLALARSDDPRAVPALFGLAGDADAGIRAAVARSLPPDPRCVDAFAALLADADKSVVTAALGRLSGGGGYDPYRDFPLARSLRGKAFGALVSAFQASLARPETVGQGLAAGYWGAYTAAAALAKTRDPRAAKAMLDAYEKADDTLKRQLARPLSGCRDFAAPEDRKKIEAVVEPMPVAPSVGGR